MRTGRPKQELILTDAETEELERLKKRHGVNQLQSLRARAVLLCAQGKNNKAVAEGLGVSARVVGKWRKRFIKKRLDALYDEPRIGRPTSISDKKIEAIIVRTLESTPKGATHWSTREMAKKAGVSASSVSLIWRAFKLKPHRSATFQLSTDPQFVDKVHDVVGLYLNPPQNAVVFCVDEKPAIQALSRTQPMLPLRPGSIERRTPEYKRHGSIDLFAALNVATGEVLGKCKARHRSLEFVEFLNLIDKNVPEDKTIQVVLDNLATHKSPLTQQWLKLHPRFTFHFTPTHASWLNQVERWFSGLTQKQLRRGSHHSVQEVKASIAAYLEATNANPRPFAWVKSADEILTSLARSARDVLSIHGGN